jgi:hypothetical protein
LAIKVYTDKLLPILRTAATSEATEQKTLAKKMVDECKPGALPNFVTDEVAQVNAVGALLAPRQVFGAVTWTNFLKLIVRKLPGGKHYLSIKGYGSWAPYHDVYARSLVHESDVVVYLLLLLLTFDNKLVQQFIGSSKHFGAFLDLQKTITVLLMKDKETIDGLDEGEESELHDEVLSSSLELFTSANNRKDKKTSPDEEISIEDIQPEKELLSIDDAVIRNMLLNL